MRSVLFLSVLALTACRPDRVEHGGGQGGQMTVNDPPDVHIEGDRLTIDDHIHFALDEAEILADSFELLDHIALLLSNHPEITALHIVGHTDASGGPEHNLDLSTRRAAAVETALRERGVSQTIDSSGVGETEHLCHEDTEECHARNRRVELLIEMR